MQHSSIEKLHTESKKLDPTDLVTKKYVIKWFFWICLAALSLITFSTVQDYVTDSFHIMQVEKLIDQALNARNNPRLSAEEKQKIIQSAQERAHAHNQKIIRRVKCSPTAIHELYKDRLRG